MSFPVPQQEIEKRHPRRWGWFVVSWGMVALVWLVLLPAHSDLPEVRRQHELWEEQGVDPSVMYYSELENLPIVLSNWRQREMEHPGALWRIPTPNEAPPAPLPTQSPTSSK